MSPIDRLPFDQLAPELQTRLAPRVKRLGYLGEFFQCVGHQPHALADFIDFTESSKAALPDGLVETLALTCAGWMGNSYEKNQHERLSVRLGLGRDWVAEVNRLDPDAARLAPDEARLQRLALTVLDSRGKAAAEPFRSVVEHLGQAAAVAALMIIGRYVTHALIVNTLDLAPPVPSIFEDGFGG